MNIDPGKWLAGKQALRRDLATRPLVEKLRLLDSLRERELTIRGRSVRVHPPSERPNTASKGS